MILAVLLFGLPIPASAVRSPGSCQYGWQDNQAAPVETEFRWREISGTGQRITPALPVIDDQAFVVDLGFDFRAYIDAVSQVAVSTNGVVSFGAFGSAAHSNEPLPSPRLPTSALAPFWDDLEVRSARGAGIFVQTLGQAPRREFVTEFSRLNHWPDLPGEITFEVILSEGSNNILVQYQDTLFGELFADRGGSATVGIQGLRARLNGLEEPTAAQYSLNQQVLPDGLAVLFDPDFTPPWVSVPKAEPGIFSPEFGESAQISATVEDGRCTPMTEFQVVGADGCVVKTLDAGAGAGPRSATWDGTDEFSLRVAPGPYWFVGRGSDGLSIGSRDSREQGRAAERYLWVAGSLPDDVVPPSAECQGEPFPSGAALYQASQRLLSGSGQLGGDRDPRTVVSGPSVSQGAAYVCGPPNSAWLPSSSEAQWIGAAPCSQPVAGGEFVYVTTFDLPGGFLSPRLAVDFAADNGVRVFLNGTQIGENPPPNGFAATVRGQTEDPALFRPGANELAFRVTNEGEGPSGLWFDATVSYATGAGTPPPPSTGPAPPRFTGTDPPSPANNNNPKILGVADPAVTVRLYTTANCSGDVAGTGTAGPDGSFSIEVTVPDDSTTAFRGTAANVVGDTSSCSESSVTYVEKSTEARVVIPYVAGSLHPGTSYDLAPSGVSSIRLMFGLPADYAARDVHLRSVWTADGQGNAAVCRTVWRYAPDASEWKVVVFEGEGDPGNQPPNTTCSRTWPAIQSFATALTIPAAEAKPGHLYEVRLLRTADDPADTLTGTMRLQSAAVEYRADPISNGRGLTPIVQAHSAQAVGGDTRVWPSSGSHGIEFWFALPRDYDAGDVVLRMIVQEHGATGGAVFCLAGNRLDGETGALIDNGFLGNAFPTGGCGQVTIRPVLTPIEIRIPASTARGGDLYLIGMGRMGDDPADTAEKLSLNALGVEYQGQAGVHALSLTPYLGASFTPTGGEREFRLMNAGQTSLSFSFGLPTGENPGQLRMRVLWQCHDFGGTAVIRRTSSRYPPDTGIEQQWEGGVAADMSGCGGLTATTIPASQAVAGSLYRILLDRFGDDAADTMGRLDALVAVVEPASG